jgi:hypothetical protein
MQLSRFLRPDRRVIAVLGRGSLAGCLGLLAAKRSAPCSNGSASIELCATLVIFPIMLVLLLDVGVLVSCAHSGDLLAKNVARSAASHSSDSDMSSAAKQVMSDYKESTLVTDVNLNSLLVSDGMVSAEIEMEVNLPGAPKGWEKVTLRFTATEPHLI